MKMRIGMLLAVLLVLAPAAASACIVTPELIPGAGIINGGFEDGTAYWNISGSAGAVGPFTIVDTVFLPYAGEKMLKINWPQTTGKFIWENSVSQDVILGPDDNYLVFYYNFWTFDEAPFDTPGFTVRINGAEVFSIGAADVGDGVIGTLDCTGWQLFQLDVSDYYSDDPRQPLLHIQFNAGNTGDRLNQSGVFLDEIRLQENPVPIPSAALLLAPGLIGLAAVRRKRR